jgi:hypothetical protein
MFGSIILIAIAVLVAAIILLWLFGERWRLLRPSTWKMMREGGLRPLRGLHGYVYGRWTNQYINLLTNRVFPRLRPKQRQSLADHYHGKVLTREQAEAIITTKGEISLQDLEQVIPYPVARDLVLKRPPDVAVYECACRHARANSCQPT